MAVRGESGHGEVVAGVDPAHCLSLFCKILRFLGERKGLIIKKDNVRGFLRA